MMALFAFCVICVPLKLNHLYEERRRNFLGSVRYILFYKVVSSMMRVKEEQRSV